jgi:hypothetical protein
MKGSGRGLFEVISQNLPGWTDEFEGMLMLVSVRAGVRNGHYRNIRKSGHYCLNQLWKEM